MFLSHTGRVRRLGFTASAGVLGVALLLTGCGGDDDDASSDDTTADDAASDDGGGYGDDPTESSAPAESGDPGAFVISEMAFEDVTAAAGSTLSIENAAGSLHTFTADDGSFDVEAPDGETVTLDVPTEPGEYPFHCEIHPDMTATLTVE